MVLLIWIWQCCGTHGERRNQEGVGALSTRRGGTRRGLGRCPGRGLGPRKGRAEVTDCAHLDTASLGVADGKNCAEVTGLSCGRRRDGGAEVREADRRAAGGRQRPGRRPAAAAEARQAAGGGGGLRDAARAGSGATLLFREAASPRRFCPCGAWRSCSAGVGRQATGAAGGGRLGPGGGGRADWRGMG